MDDNHFSDAINYLLGPNYKRPMEETFAYAPKVYYVFERGTPMKFVGKTWGLRKCYFDLAGLVVFVNHLN